MRSQSRFMLLGGLVIIIVVVAAIVLTHSSGTKSAASTETPIPAATSTVTTSTAQLDEGTSVFESNTGVSGHLLVIEAEFFPVHRIARLDLATGELERFFEPPQNGYIHNIGASPDGTQVVMSYSQPPTGDATPFDRSGIFTISVEQPEAEPTMLLNPDEHNIFYREPVWAPDNSAIYFERHAPGEAPADGGPALSVITLVRYDMATGEVSDIAEKGAAVAVSPDGSKIAYVTVDRFTQEGGLFLADADGSNAVEISNTDEFYDVGVPLFSPDGEWLYFATFEEPVQPTQAASLWQQLTGIGTAYAHVTSLPPDWRRVPVAGGAIELVTDQVEKDVIYVDFDGSGEHIITLATEGIYAMNSDGSNIQPIVLTLDYRDIDWVP